MAFDKRESAKLYEPLPGDTLAKIAARESENGNPLTWQEIARFNWGTDDPVEVQSFLRDELGTRHRDVDGHFVIGADDEAQGTLLIPMRFKREGLAPKRTYTLKIKRKETRKQFLECCHVPGVTFEFDSSFLSPDVAPYLRKLEAVANRHKNGKILVFGHTDAVGDEGYNKRLSERRAWSVYAFITNDVKAWETLYNHPDEHWGTSVIQQILGSLGHSPGTIDGALGPKTRNAMRAFLGLPEKAPVTNDEAFRAKLFEAYMTSVHDVKLDVDRFMKPGFMGCGEFNPVDLAHAKSEENRRVTFFLFDEQRLPHLPCTFASTEPCARQMITGEHRFKDSFRCNLYDSLARSCSDKKTPKGTDWISFELRGELDGQPMEGVRYTLETLAGDILEGIVSSSGTVRIEDVPTGNCTLRFENYHAAEWGADPDEGALPQDAEEPAESVESDESDPDEGLNEETLFDPVEGDENPFMEAGLDDEDESAEIHEGR